MGKRTDKCIRDFIASVAAPNLNPAKAFLFGSYGRGNGKLTATLTWPWYLIT